MCAWGGCQLVGRNYFCYFRVYSIEEYVLKQSKGDLYYGKGAIDFMFRWFSWFEDGNDSHLFQFLWVCASYYGIGKGICLLSNLPQFGNNSKYISPKPYVFPSLSFRLHMLMPLQGMILSKVFVLRWLILAHFVLVWCGWACFILRGTGCDYNMSCNFFRRD